MIHRYYIRGSRICKEAQIRTKFARESTQSKSLETVAPQRFQGSYTVSTYTISRPLHIQFRGGYIYNFETLHIQKRYPYIYKNETPHIYSFETYIYKNETPYTVLRLYIYKNDTPWLSYPRQFFYHDFSHLDELGSEKETI